MQELAVRDGLVSRCVVSVQLFEYGNSTPSIPPSLYICVCRGCRSLQEDSGWSTAVSKSTPSSK